MPSHPELLPSPRPPIPARARRGLVLAGALALLAGAGCTSSSDCGEGLTREGSACVDAYTWVLVVNDEGSVSLLDAATGRTHGPYLKGKLGDAGDLMDAVVTPDGKTALVSAFSKKRVYFIDLTDLTAPALLGHVDVEIFAEDLTLTPDGKHVLVTDGGYSPQIVSIDVENRAVVETIRQTYVYTNAGAMAPDGTLVVASYVGPSTTSDAYGKTTVHGGSLSTFTVDAAGHLTHGNDYPLFLRASGMPTANPRAHTLHPVNVAVAPDGQTVLVPDVSRYNSSSAVDPTPDYSAGIAQYAIAVYRITAPGELTFKDLITVPRAVQSIAFSASGDEAYLLGNGGQVLDEATGTATASETDRLLVLKISAPGVVSYDATRSADLQHTSSSQLFGVDSLVVRRGKAYATYSTSSYDKTSEPLRVVSAVDLATFGVSRIAPGLPAGGDMRGLALVPRRDSVAVPEGEATCAGACGTANRDQGCFCDATCAARGDCCADYQALCTSCDATTCTGGNKACANQDAGYSCGCASGYALDGSGTCVDVDECEAGTATCQASATCTNTFGGFTCACPAGFTSDGAGGCECPYGFQDDGAGGCAAVDLCAAGLDSCQPSATCTPSSGTYTCTCTAPFIENGFGGCTCPAGYQDDGAGGCADVDECAAGLAACSGAATCRNTVGGYACDCPSPLVANGHGGCKAE